MDAQDLIKAGRLSDARKAAVEEVKSSPGDIGKRTLLFQILSFCGEWDKAERHLDTMAAQDPSRETGIQVYKNLLQAERERIEVAGSKARPSFLPAIPPYAEVYFAAREKLAEEKIEEAQALFGQVEAGLPALSGTLNGESFAGFKDTDAFLSLFLEAMVHDRYLWIPIESIRELSISAPKTLFDLLWVTAHITTWEGLSLGCYLPVLYPGSYLHEDERVKMGRITDWSPLGWPLAKGMGQHVFQIGQEEVAILEIREVLFKAEAESNENTD